MKLIALLLLCSISYDRPLHVEKPKVEKPKSEMKFYNVIESATSTPIILMPDHMPWMRGDYVPEYPPNVPFPGLKTKKKEYYLEIKLPQ